MRQRLPLGAATPVLAALVLGAVALAACGGDDDGGEDTAAIRAAAVRIVTTTDEEVACGELMTARYVRRIYGDLRRCHKAERPDEGERTPTDADASVVKAGDGVATVRIRIIGGDIDGVAGTISLRDESGGWRLDRTGTDLVDALVAAGLRMGFGDDIPRDAIACVARRLRSSIGDGEDLLRVIVAEDRDTGPDVLRALFACRPSEIRERFESGVRDAIGDELPDDVTDCIIRRLRSSVSDDELLMLLRDRATARQAGERAARTCVAQRRDNSRSSA